MTPYSFAGLNTVAFIDTYVKQVDNGHMRTHSPAPMHSRAPIPPIVRWKITLRAKGRCEDCGQRVPLELHHCTYWITGVHSSFREPIFGYEKETDLKAICRDCHFRRHIDSNGVFWADPEEMYAHDYNR